MSTKVNANAFRVYRGEDVIPLIGKRPRDKGWTTKAYKSAEVIARCIRDNCNMGRRLSAEELVIDVDPRNGGVEGFAALCADIGLNEADFPRVKTGSGGFHYYMGKPQGLRIKDTHPDYPGVEFKSEGRQVVAAGSIHPDTGKHYVWIEEPTFGLPEAPEALLELVKRPERSGEVTGGEYTSEQIADKLEALDVTEFRDQEKWLSLMMACHHATGGEARQEFIDWSTSDPKYAHDGDLIGRRWDSLRANKSGGKTVGTLNMILSEHGVEPLPNAMDEDEFGPIVEETNKTVARFKAMSLSSVMALPDPVWLVEGILTENCLFEIFGQFKAAKTFYGLELGLCISTGLDFFDCKTVKGKVLYVIAEGNVKLFGYRIQAWINERAGGDVKKAKRLAADVEANFAIVPFSVPMDAPKTVEAFLDANPGKYAAIFVDTLMRNMTGDPMKPADMMKFMGGCDAIRNKTGAAVVFLHHMRREGGVGGYGPIIGEAFVDGAACVFRKGKERLFKLYVMRDGDDSAPAWRCHLETRNVLMSWGKERDTAVLVYIGRGGLSDEDKVLITIRDAMPDTVTELAKESKVAKRSVERILAKLRDAKPRLVMADVLRLTPEGKEAADMAGPGNEQ